MLAMQRVIAAAYKQAPLFSSLAKPSWLALAAHSVENAARLRSLYAITETAESQPYRSAAEMFSDLEQGRMLVSNANSVHPLWTVAENVAFRITHDITGHYAAHCNGAPVADFSWEGELAAAEWHTSTLPVGIIRDALFTEVVGQAAFFLVYGTFTDQKVAFLW